MDCYEEENKNIYREADHQQEEDEDENEEDEEEEEEEDEAEDEVTSPSAERGGEADGAPLDSTMPATFDWQGLFVSTQAWTTEGLQWAF